MTETNPILENLRPWEKLEKMIQEEADEQIKEYIKGSESHDLRIAINHLSASQRVKLFNIIDPDDAADLLSYIPDSQGISIIEDLEYSDAASIVDEMQSDDQADLLKALDYEDAEQIIKNLDEEDSVRKLVGYESNTAGGLMITEFLAFDENESVQYVVEQLRENAEKYADYNVQYLYVTSSDRFSGVLQVRDLLMSQADIPLRDIVIKDALTVYDSDDIDELINFFNTHDFYGVPVISEDRELVGVVLRKDIRETEAERSNMELLETQGIVGGEELRTMPILLRSRRRLSWLSVNIVLNIIAASVIALYADTLSAVIALAVFLPVISDMSGCSGNQAVAVSLRELSLGVVRPFEIFRVWVQEVSVGIINGLALGLLIGLVAWLWQGNIVLGIVVGSALCINTIVAVSLGGVLPLILKKWNVDPALASGPILTTVTDMMGFFLALSFSAAALSHLVN